MTVLSHAAPAHGGRLSLFRRRVVPGSAPGVVNVDPHAWPTEIQTWSYGADGFDSEDLDAVPTILETTERTIWIRVQGLGDAAILERLQQLVGIHPLAQEDIVNVDQRAKADAYEEGLFVVVRAPVLDGQHVTEQVSMFVTERIVVSFEERPGPLLDPLLNRIRVGKGRIRRRGPDYLLYAVVDTVVDSFFPVVERFADELFELEEQIMGSPDRPLLQSAHRLKRRIALLRRDAWPHRDLVGQLQRDDRGRIDPGTLPFLADVRDHVVQLVEHLDQLRDQAQGAMDLHVSLLDSRMNEVMKVLTMVAAIFIPLSFLSSLYGMNFDREASPWNMPELGWRYGYPVFLGVLAMVAVAVLAWFRRQGWLGSAGARGPRGSSDSPAP